MSAPITKEAFTFELPKLSYIDATWEEPNLREAAQPTSRTGFAAWLTSRVDAFRAWNRQWREFGELSGMNDRELADIGLNRGDLHRVFTDAYNTDLKTVRGRR